MVAAFAAGCSSDGDPEQQASTDLPSASSSSAEPTPELPPLGPAEFPVPDEARVQDEAGAQAFFEYYIELLNRQQAVPDGQPLRELSPDCRDCLAIAQRFDEAAAAGYDVEGGTLTVIEGPGIGLATDRANITFSVRTDAVAVTGPDGEPVPEENQPAIARVPSFLELTWSDDQASWLASGLSFG